MQIRLGTRQDEPAISRLVCEVMHEFNLPVLPDGAESDLKNIEESYFTKDGLFLVAEEEGQLKGIASARRLNDEVLELVRLAVAKSSRNTGIARELMETILNFARDLEYKKVQVEPARQYPGGDRFLMYFGFTSDMAEDAQQPWYYLIENKIPTHK